MIRVVALARHHLADASQLFVRTFGPAPRDPDSPVVPMLAATLFDHPWADEELPSLAALDGDRLVGFIGVLVRRWRLGGEPRRIALTSYLSVEPAARSQAVGVLLLQHVLRGAQDATLADSANAVTQRIWERLGGETLHLQSIEWLRVVRPWGLAARRAGARARRPGLATRLAAPAGPLDHATAALLGSRVRPPRPAGRTEPLDAAGLLELLPAAAARRRLWPDYDLGYLEWLFREYALMDPQARVVRRRVIGASGSALGWFVYVLRADRRAEVAQIAAPAPHTAGVLEHLLAHAHAEGATHVVGRLEPALLGHLGTPPFVLRPGPVVLLHSRDDALLAAARSGAALLTRLDGEWRAA